MKKIEIIIKPESLGTISNTLINAGAVDMTVSQVRKFDRLNGQIQRYRGLELSIKFTTKIKLEIVVDDSQVSQVLEKLVAAVPNEEIGSSKIFIIPIEEVPISEILTQTLATAQG